MMDAAHYDRPAASRTNGIITLRASALASCPVALAAAINGHTPTQPPAPLAQAFADGHRLEPILRDMAQPMLKTRLGMILVKDTHTDPNPPTLTIETVANDGQPVRFNVSGTFDDIGMVGGNLYVIDYKTASEATWKKKWKPWIDVNPHTGRMTVDLLDDNRITSYARQMYAYARMVGAKAGYLVVGIKQRDDATGETTIGEIHLVRFRLEPGIDGMLHDELVNVHAAVLDALDSETSAMCTQWQQNPERGMCRFDYLHDTEVTPSAVGAGLEDALQRWAETKREIDRFNRSLEVVAVNDRAKQLADELDARKRVAMTLIDGEAAELAPGESDTWTAGGVTVRVESRKESVVRAHVRVTLKLAD